MMEDNNSQVDEQPFVKKNWVGKTYTVCPG